MDKLAGSKSKLSNLSQGGASGGAKVGLVKKSKGIAKIKTFRLSNDDIKALEGIRELVNQNTRGRISDAKVIKALIQIGSKLETQKIIKALAEII